MKLVIIRSSFLNHLRKRIKTLDRQIRCRRNNEGYNLMYDIYTAKMEGKLNGYRYVLYKSK
jgi:hypothetical protein